MKPKHDGTPRKKPQRTAPYLYQQAPVRTRLLAAFSLGATIDIACAAAGITKPAYYAWYGAYCRRDASVFPGLDDLFEAIESARASGAIQMLAVIQRAATDGRNWQAAAWRLERRYPRDYGRPETRMGQDAPDQDADAGTKADLDTRIEAALRRAEGGG